MSGAALEAHGLSLRVVPRPFRSVLFHEGRGTPAQEVTWDFGAEGISRRRPAARTAVVSHAADRLAKAIVLATTSATDPRTLTAWGQSVGVSRGALRVWCKTAGVSARSCLDFLRVLRAVMLSQNQDWDLLGILDVVDKRSLFQLLDRGGVREMCQQPAPSVTEFVAGQRFLDNQQVLEAVSRRLDEPRS